MASRKPIIVLSILLLSLACFMFYDLASSTPTTLKTWTFEDKSMYTDYKVAVTANDTWEVGTEQVMTLTIEVTGTEEGRDGYLKIESIEMGVVLSTRTEVVSETLNVGDSYTHTMKFYVTEDDYGIYENKVYEKSLSFTIKGRSYYRSYTGEMDSVSLFNYESWTITVQGIKPVMGTEWSDTTVTQGTPIKVNVTVKYPSGRPIEGCTATIWIGLKKFTSYYKGDGIYSITINTDDLSGTKEFEINVMKSLYYDYDLVPREGEKYKITILIPTTITCEVSKDKITQGDSITVSGSISPKRADVTVTLSYTQPDGSIISRTTTTKSDGTYSDSYKPDAVGTWSVSASWAGDDTYGGSSSTSKSFTVEEKKGCIIATTTYGSELSPEVQFLREVRDQEVMSTFAGSQFMTVFNQFYYSFSPQVASVIRANPFLKEMMRYLLYPLMGILHLASMIFYMLSLSPEIGIVIAGLVTSSLIGVVYLTPLLVIPLRVKRFHKHVLKTMKLLSIILASSLVMILTAEIVSSPMIMMLATGTLVLATLSLSALSVSKGIIKLLEH